jgi:magnesium chelatase subunit D
LRKNERRAMQRFFLYPFSAIVGQEKLKRALLANAVDPRIGGLLIRGERGSGKSTAARALAELLPEVDVVADCPFSCSPHDEEEMCESCFSRWREGEPLPIATRPMRFVTLPLNASEDRVVGTLDLEKALRKGVKEFEPGILAAANRSILYVDEVNLLDDHLVDLLLDAAAMGVNVVEREGVSFSHPSRFILVGTMNPEEGELRPQLEDRFGLCVEVKGERDPELRMEVLRRRRSFLEDPHLFRASFREEQEELRRRVTAARDNLHRVQVGEDMLRLITSICLEMEVCGHRADIALWQTARALAALDGAAAVGPEHVKEAAELALIHRLRKTPFDEPSHDAQKLEKVIAKGDGDAKNPAGAVPTPAATAALRGERKAGRREEEGTERKAAAAARVEAPLPRLAATECGMLQAAKGKRSTVTTAKGPGKGVGHRLPRPEEELAAEDVAVGATIRAAAARAAGKGNPFQVKKEDLRVKIRKRKAGHLILFVLDASASMGCHARIEATKGVINRLLVDAYQKRDRVGLVTFKDQAAQLVLSPTSSIRLAGLRIKEVSTGGSTPLNHGLAMGYRVMKRELRRDPDVLPLMVLITDGHGNVGYASDDPLRESLEMAAKIREEKLKCLVIDTSGAGRVPGVARPVPTQARRIADAMGAQYHRLETMRPDEMLRLVESARREGD